MMVNDLENEFHQHKKYSDNLRRLRKKKLPKHGGKPGQLPPLEEIDDVKNGGVSVSQEF